MENCEYRGGVKLYTKNVYWILIINGLIILDRILVLVHTAMFEIWFFKLYLLTQLKNLFYLQFAQDWNRDIY